MNYLTDPFYPQVEVSKPKSNNFIILQNKNSHLYLSNHFKMLYN